MKLKTGNQERKDNETKSQFLEKINKTDKPEVRLRKKDRTQIIIIRHERRDITTDPIHIRRIIKEHYKQLYTHECDNWDEMD